MTELPNLRREARSIGKTEWRPMLSYTAELHERSTHPPRPPFPFPWEEIGPGYCGGPAFGHWDIVHQIMDVLDAEPEHARMQILNDLAAQEGDGLVPGSIYLRDDGPNWSKEWGHPPLWPLAAEDYCNRTSSLALMSQCYEALIRQIGWFEAFRSAEPDGFYYLDVLRPVWESGVDEGVRFDDAPSEALACVDATAHVYLLYNCAAEWAARLGGDAESFDDKAEALGRFIQNELYDPETGFFHDSWAVGRPERRRLAFEGMWPLVVGAATEQQAERVITENLLEPSRFFTEHPIASVPVCESKFELRMWRGCAWNSMTYWAARGCARYGYAEAARKLLERALDDTALQFERTGTIWEFYHPQGGRPEDLRRKPHTPFNVPCRDYLGHNPLIAMCRLWEASGGSAQ